nr:hypothetical protein [Methanospirillum stamsii]
MRDDLTRIADILEAIHHIERYQPADFDEFLENELIQVCSSLYSRDWRGISRYLIGISEAKPFDSLEADSGYAKSACSSVLWC